MEPRASATRGHARVRAAPTPMRSTGKPGTHGRCAGTGSHRPRERRPVRSWFGLGVVRPALRLVQLRAGGVVVQDGDEPGGRPFVLGQALEEVGRRAGRVADLLGNGGLPRPQVSAYQRSRRARRGGRPRVGPRSTLPEVSGAQPRQALRMRSARLVPAGHRSGGAPTGEFRPARDRGRERSRCPGRPSPAGCATGRARRRRRERRRPTSPRRAAGTAPGRGGRRSAAGCG